MAVMNAGILNHEYGDGSTTEVHVAEGHGTGEEVDSSDRDDALLIMYSLNVDLRLSLRNT